MARDTKRICSNHDKGLLPFGSGYTFDGYAPCSDCGSDEISDDVPESAKDTDTVDTVYCECGHPVDMIFVPCEDD